MFARTALTALVAAVALSSVASARPVVNQLQLSNYGVASQSTFTTEKRAADDFVPSVGNLHPHRITQIKVEMIGNGTPTPSKFGVTIYKHNGVPFMQGPGAVIKTRTTASSVLNMGSTGSPGMYKYIVTFNFLPGEVALAPLTRYWISGFVRNDDSRSWGFGRAARPISGYAAKSLSLLGWHDVISASDMAFQITTIQP